MAITGMSFIDVAKVNSSEQIIGCVSEALTSVPEVNLITCSPVQKNSFKTLVCTANPTVDFRQPGVPRPFDSAVLQTKQIDLAYLDCSFVLERAIAQASDFGEEYAISIQMQASIAAGLQKFAETIWTGTSAGGSFDGYRPICEAANCAIVDAGNTGISDGSAVYMISTSPTTSQLCFGQNGTIHESDVREVLLASTNSNSKYSGSWFLGVDLGFWLGLAVYNKWSVGCIKNLSGVSGKNGLNDDMLYELYSKFPVSYKPQYVFMSRRSLFQLQKSRSAVSYTGQYAEIPTKCCGNLPIIVTDAIKDDETVA